MNTTTITPNKSTLSRDLYTNIVRVRPTSLDTNNRLHDLLRYVDRQMGEWHQEGKLAERIGPMGVHGIPANVRIATFEIPTLRPLVQSSEDPRASDGAGKGEYRLHASKEFIRNHAVLDYLQRLLTQELLDLCAIALEAAAGWGPEPYHVVGTLDWYQDRKTDDHGLHKDTTGSTLFVALHYANDRPILGAEYVYDFWPMKSSVEYPGPDVWWRSNAPWCEGRVAWPRVLVQALEQARAAIDRPNGRHVVDCKVIPPNGLITFVDELLYHATPLEGRRDPEERRDLFTKVGVGGKTDYKLPVPGLWIDEKRLSEDHVLTRTVSRERLTAPVRGTDNKRRFVRLWICVQPKKWTK